MLFKEKLGPKICTIDEAVNIIKDSEKKVVFTNGCFDLIHLGHIEYLLKAKELGDMLIVGVNSDVSVKRLKGPTRPIMDQTQRYHIMAALSFVDIIIPFDEETPYNLIKMIKPDVLVKGSDYKPELIVGYDIVKENGGEIITIPTNLPPEIYSTTKILERVILTKK
jgi:rfaE bifunctional protein nucleotidyltransferase chain/domain